MTLEFNSRVPKRVPQILQETQPTHRVSGQDMLNRVNEDRNQVKQAFIGTAKLETFVQAYNRMFSQSDMHA